MSDTIFNEDGTVYMTFTPPVPSQGDQEGWFVRHVTSGTHTGPKCQSHRTRSTVDADCMSFNELLKLVGANSDYYGYRPPSSKIGSQRAFRWSWEMVLPSGHRLSEMIIATKIA